MNDSCMICGKDIEHGEKVIAMVEWHYDEIDLGNNPIDYMCTKCHHEINDNDAEMCDAISDLLLTVYDVADDSIKGEFEDLTGKAWVVEDPSYNELPDELKDFMYAKAMRVDDLLHKKRLIK